MICYTEYLVFKKFDNISIILSDILYTEKIKAGDVFCMNYDIACEPLNLEGEKFMHGQIAPT